MPNRNPKDTGLERLVKYVLTISILSLLLPLPVPKVLKAAEPVLHRFFLMGDGRLDIRNSKTGRRADVRLFLSDGSPDEKSLTEVDTVFGFPAGKNGGHISLRLLSMIDYFSDLVAPGKTINLDSGYRSPRYNAKLHNAGRTVARTSEHMDGMAADFNIGGVDGQRLWEIIRQRNCCGVGYYGGADIHLDSGRPRFWETATSKVGTMESAYNRKIYLSTDFDRYRTGETMRLSLSAISDFPFGVNRTVDLVAEKDHSIAAARIIAGKDSACIPILNRQAAHALFVSLPAGLSPGRYRIQMQFCRLPFPQMPAQTVSSAIELLDRPAERGSH